MYRQALENLPEAQYSRSGVTMGYYPHQVEVSSLEYADDAGLLDEDELAASAWVTALAIGSRTDVAVEISKLKTKAFQADNDGGSGGGA